MTVRRLDSATGDIITSGDQFIDGRDEIAQTIKTRLRLYLGEYFRDIADGTPWFQYILTKDGTLESKDAIIKRRISQTSGVSQIMSYNADFDIPTRVYTIDCTVLTGFGLVDFTISGGA